MKVNFDLRVLLLDLPLEYDGKMTVIKTLCLLKIKHTVTVVSNQGVKFIRKIDAEFNTFILLPTTISISTDISVLFP